jgi:hypothetical protein
MLVDSQYATDNCPNTTRIIEKISIAGVAFNEDFTLLHPYVYDKKSNRYFTLPEEHFVLPKEHL